MSLRMAVVVVALAGCSALGVPLTGPAAVTGPGGDLGSSSPSSSDLAGVATPDGGTGPDGSDGLFDPEKFVTLPNSVSYGNAVAVGDVTGDGRADVVVQAATGNAVDGAIIVVPQAAGGTLATPISYPLGQASAVNTATIAIGDLDGDGLLDVAAAGAQGVGILLQNAAGMLRAPQTVAYSVSCRANHVFAVDVDRDGRLDLVAGGTSCRGVDVWTHNGDGTFAAPAHFDCPAIGSDDLAVGDLNGDGRPDVALMVGAQACLLIGSAQGYTTARTVALDGSASGIAVGDVNHDGRADLVITGGGNRPSSYLHWYAQNAQGTLDAPVSLASIDLPAQVVLFDVDGDGWVDALTLHSAFFSMGIYRQMGSGGLAPETTFSYSNESRFAVGDVNGDGRPDIVAISSSKLLSIAYHR